MITIKNLSKKYEENWVLENFSHTFIDRGITCLLGVSGSGKSTLFNLLAGFDHDYSGEILVAGQNIADLSEDALSKYRKHCIGFVFQEYNLLAGYTVLENILLAADLTCADQEQSKAWGTELLERLGIAEKANEKIENLSGGQKQRAAIARALVGDPAVILADEPTGALDRNTSDEIMAIFSEIAKERPVLIITHDQKICDFADEVITITEGKCKIQKEAKQSREETAAQLQEKTAAQPSMKKRAFQNFYVHRKYFFGISLALTIAVCAILMSLSSQNIIDGKINAFEEKNTAFAWGQVVLSDEVNLEDLLSELKRSSKIERYYTQYNVPESKITISDQQVSLPKKAFGSIAAETMNMGVMPGEGEIAITPSLAKQLKEDIRTLIGTKITFECGGFSKTLTISGIFNGTFDDYYLSNSEEQELYAFLNPAELPVSVAYKANGFHEVLQTEELLLGAGFTPITAKKQVESLQTAFDRLQTLFVVASLFILAISIFICIILLTKTAQIQAKDMGIIMAVGYSNKQMKQMLFHESLFLSALSVVTIIVILCLLTVLSGTFYTQVIITPTQFAFGICGTLIFVWLTTTLSNRKLLRTDLAIVLRK